MPTVNIQEVRDLVNCISVVEKTFNLDQITFLSIRMAAKRTQFLALVRSKSYQPFLHVRFSLSKSQNEDCAFIYNIIQNFLRIMF